MREYDPLLKDRWSDDYFSDRNGNNLLRNLQFEIDAKFIKRYIDRGILCDIGCSTGEFVRQLNWMGDKFGMEINEHARSIAADQIDFSKNIFTESNFFDLVIFRGTIQHVDEPFRMMKASAMALKKGGYICFLATPNTNSILYKLKNNLPFLDPKTNFYIPGDKELTNALENYGFKVVKIDYPYLKTPYCNFFSDHIKFLLNLLSRKFYPHAFYRSSMSVMAVKI